MKKFLVATFIEYNGCQLTIDQYNDFKDFIKQDAFDIQTTFKDIKDKQVPMEISFKWNPDGCDYPPTVCVKLNECFLYEVGNKCNYQVIDAEKIVDLGWYSYES